MLDGVDEGQMEILGSLIREVTGVDETIPYFVAGRKYRLSRFNLVRAGYPAEIQNDQRLQKFNSNLRMPIVVEKNRERYGNVPALRYFAPAIVIAGAARRAKLLAEGNTRAWGWVEKGALPLQGEDVISSQEILQALQTQLAAKIARPTPLAFPWMIAFNPFENYFIYQIEGQRFRLGFNLSADSRDIFLAGVPQEVTMEYVQMTAQRDLLHRVCVNWGNAREAVRMFLGDVKHGVFKTVKCSSYLPDSQEPIFAYLDQKLIGYMDFVRWSLQEQADNSYKTINGRKYSSAKFTTPSRYDKSTWIVRNPKKRCSE